MNRAVPLIIVLTPNTLSSIGLRDILAKILPFAIVKVCDTMEELLAIEPTDIFHIFISSHLLVENISSFDPLRNKCIALTNGSANSNALQGFHQINIQQPEEKIIEAIKELQSHAHGHSHHPSTPTPETTELLSPREIEVTKLLIEGLINKEIATKLNIGVTTVITHRKNIFEKLGIRSLGGLTIYAIMKRYIEI
ncbi:MAG: LuxR C-terminal-related transcriptional regulator [Rikenellaceae bacterium]